RSSDLPFHPDNVTVSLNSVGQRVYEIKIEGKSPRTLPQQDVFHLPGLTLNGWQGVSVLSYARETVGLSMATEKHGAKLFSNGAKMGGILTFPGRWKDPETKNKVAASFDEKTSGDSAHGTVVLEEGMKWEKVTMTSDDAQFLETRKFQVPEIARFFRMPLHKIQEMGGATFSNIEQQALEFLTDCIMPWLCRWEQTLNTTLLSEKEQEEYYFEFLVDGLLRGDIQSRYAAYSQGILSGFMTRNEVRARENLNWLDGLDDPLYPTNMAVAGTVPPGVANGQN
ncbi:MAG: phage portal protein, partial [Geobacteraceae bacterium]|nr:phage portal protein [Geobacteraceae bacterium]